MSGKTGTDDGSDDAPAATIQMPRLLNDYPHRPDHPVAGVDYAVGPPDALELDDWQDIEMEGVEVNKSKGEVNIRLAGVKLNGIDFTKNDGAAVNVTGANGVAVTKSKFGGSRVSNLGAGIINTDPSSPNMTVKYCDIDGNGAGTTATLLFVRGGGKTILQYNYFRNFPQHVVEFVDDLGDIDYRWNLISQGGMQKEAHLNHLQFGAGTGTANVRFNTFVQEGAQPASGEGLQFYFNSPQGAKLLKAWCTNNTCIARGGDVGMVMSYMLHGGPCDAGELRDNFFDPSATWGALYPNSFNGWAISGNVNMNDGNEIA